MIIFTEKDIRLRQMEDRPEEYAMVARWLSDASVLEYYEGRDHPFSFEEAVDHFHVPDRLDSGETPCIMEYQDRPIGYLQFYPAGRLEYQFDQPGSLYALDLFIGEPEYWNHGLGTRFIRGLLRVLFDEKGADWVILDPHTDNLRAIRAYEKCGFKQIKLLPGHELHERKLVDCWLMAVQHNEFVNPNG